MRRALQPPPRRRALPLQQLQHAPLVAVGRLHVAVREPLGVRRDMGGHEERLRGELQRHQVVVLHRTGGDCGNIDRSRDAMCSPIDTIIVAPAMRASSASAETPGGGHGDASSHMRRLRKAGSSASMCDRAVDPVRGKPTPRSSTSTSCVVDLGVTRVPVLDLEPVHERADERAVERLRTELVESRLRARPTGPAPRALPARSRRRSRCSPVSFRAWSTSAWMRRLTVALGVTRRPSSRAASTAPSSRSPSRRPRCTARSPAAAPGTTRRPVTGMTENVGRRPSRP